MKKTVLLSVLLLAGSALMASSKTDTKAALELMQRTTGCTELPVKLKISPKKSSDGTKTYFSYRVGADGRLEITASDPVALCRGFYDFAGSNGGGIYSWSGSNLTMPSPAKADGEKTVVSPFTNHYYFNVCTFGYSMPYWDWARWEKEIDWMALHGFNMPLAQNAYEAIIARVWKKMGLTDEEINGYFSAPAHLPWNRMGNIHGHDGGLDADWHKNQIELQHKILDRMRALGMKPICPGFAGFVPKAMKRVHPEVELIESKWSGGAFNNWMISPQEPLFTEIGTAFIREWEKEFDRCDMYLVDSFNEMEIPFPPKGTKERYELLASYGDKVYQSIRRANPRAVWVMQGWMFGYQRHIWDYETLKALLSAVPDDKMLLLDLAVDYNRHFWHTDVNWDFYKGFCGKPWVYSVIPSMGGKTAPTGILEFYANGHLDALSSPDKGKLIAHGMAPEGIENNEVIYELLSEAGWSANSIDLRKWLEDYSVRRYGSCPDEIKAYWDDMLASVYGSFTDHPRYSWQFRPGTVKRGSVNANERFFRAVESFISAGDSLKTNQLYLNDAAELTALYLGAKAELLLREIDRQYEKGDTVRAAKLEADFRHVMLGMDCLLESHPNLRLERWTDFARAHRSDDAVRDRYESNAKRIVTVWGPPVDDYSARIWSGLIRDYYLPRWEHYFASRKSGEPFDFAAWEEKWVTAPGLSAPSKTDDLFNTARSLIDYTAFIRP